MNPTTEEVEFKEIPGFPLYRVGTDGSYWSRCRSGPTNRLRDDWKRLNPGSGYGPAKNRYVKIFLRDGDKVRHTRLHSVVLEAFVGPCPEGMEACHNNGQRWDCRLSNLRWDTPKANQSDRRTHRTAMEGEDSPNARLTDDGVLELRRLWGEGHSAGVLADQFGISAGAARGIAVGKSWKHLPIVRRASKSATYRYPTRTKRGLPREPKNLE